MREQAALHAEASKYAAVIYFPVGSAVIDQDGIRQLNWFVDKMKPYPQANFLVQGFADSTGGEATNQQLSLTRAQAVATYLSRAGHRPSAHGRAGLRHDLRRRHQRHRRTAAATTAASKSRCAEPLVAPASVPAGGPTGRRRAL